MGRMGLMGFIGLRGYLLGERKKGLLHSRPFPFAYEKKLEIYPNRMKKYTQLCVGEAFLTCLVGQVCPVLVFLELVVACDNAAFRDFYFFVCHVNI